MEKAALVAIKYITNPYALTAFIVLIAGYTYVKIRSGNNNKQNNSNNIKVSGRNNDVSDINQSIKGRDDSE